MPVEHYIYGQNILEETDEFGANKTSNKKPARYKSAHTKNTKIPARNLKEIACLRARQTSGALPLFFQAFQQNTLLEDAL